MTSDALRDWCLNNAGTIDRSPSDLAGRWEEYAAARTPVITVFGSYDTGKSSLIRRLLVDAQVPVPEWLTISARHETFDVREAVAGPVRFRDTPGIAVGASDLRGTTNTATAIAAIEPTDILIVTVTSQLATGERDVLMEIIGHNWAPGALRFVITRFDEAGQDPFIDPDGYQALATSKIDELRTSLDLDADVPVDVVAQDPFQLGGDARDVDPVMYDEFRSWDGMTALHDALIQTSADADRLRTASEDRYWESVARLIDDELSTVLPELIAAAIQARKVATETEDWRRQLDDLDESARAGLRAAISATLQGAGAPTSAARDHLADDLRDELDEWLRRQTAHLDRLVQEAGAAARRERARPQWQHLDGIISDARASAAGRAADHSESANPNIAGHMAKARSALRTVMTTLLKETDGPKIGKYDIKAIHSQIDQGLEFAVAVAPLVDSLVTDVRRKNALKSATRAALRQAEPELFAETIIEWEAIRDVTAELFNELGGNQGLIAGAAEAEVERIQRLLDEFSALAERD